MLGVGIHTRTTSRVRTQAESVRYMRRTQHPGWCYFNWDHLRKDINVGRYFHTCWMKADDHRLLVWNQVARGIWIPKGAVLSMTTWLYIKDNMHENEFKFTRTERIGKRKQTLKLIKKKKLPVVLDRKYLHLNKQTHWKYRNAVRAVNVKTSRPFLLSK